MMKCLYVLLVVFHVAAGCAISDDNKQTEITRNKGDSVLLPCSCSDLNTKPQKLTWEIYRTDRLTEVLNDEHYHGRFQLFNTISPGNLSLFISDLRAEDQGQYRCSTEIGHRVIMLYVNGCKLVKKTELEDVTGFTGESVVLPCVCTDLQDKPQDLTWKFISRRSGTGQYQDIYPNQTKHHRNRVKLVSTNSPGNVSLLISDLTEEDEGHYRCSIQNDDRVLRLSVKGRSETPKPPSPPKPPTSPSQSEQLLMFGVSAVLLLVITGVVAFICWKSRGGRCGKNVFTEGHPDCKGNQKDQIVSDVTYSTVTLINTAGAARVQINTGECTEYASIITN